MNNTSDNSNELPILLIPSLRAGGGAERQVEILYKKGIFSEIITLENINEFDIPDSAITCLTQHNRNTSRVFMTLFIPIYAWLLYKHVRSSKARTIVSVLERANFVNIVAKPLLKHRAITNTQVHVFSFYTSKSEKLNLLLMRILYRFADRVSANSSLTVNDLQSNFNLETERCFLLPNFYYSDSIQKRAQQPLSEFHQSIFSHTTLLNVGRLMPQKGPWHALRLFAQVHKLNPAVKLVMLNDGELRDDLIELAKRLGLETYSSFNNDEEHTNYDVFFLGIQKNPYQFFSRCTISIHPSYCEGLPNALIESRISGAACVASDCPSGPREIIAPESNIYDIAKQPEVLPEGVLLPPFLGGDPNWTIDTLDKVENMWVEVLTKLLGSPEQITQIRQKSQTAIRRYDIDNAQQFTDALLASN